MTIEIGQLAALFLLVASVLKLVDWLMTDDQKRTLEKALNFRLHDQKKSFIFVAKTPVIALSSILADATDDPVLKNKSWKRTSAISVFLLSACLFSAGLATDTMLGFEQNPSDSYRKKIEIFERLISVEHDSENLTDAEKQEMLQFRQDVSRILETAKHPFARWASLTLVSIVIGFISVGLTRMALRFTGKTTTAITTTDSSLLIAGAILLNGLVSLLIFFLGVVVLSIVSSELLMFAFSLVGILLKLGPLWGTASFASYGVFAWITAPIWLKALAAASLVPFLVMVTAILFSFVVKPLINPLSLLLTVLLRRAVTHKDGAVAFFAAGFICLAAAITAATNIVN